MSYEAIDMLRQRDRVMTTFIALHTDEELIRLERRARNAAHEGLANVLAAEVNERDQAEKRLSELNL